MTFGGLNRKTKDMTAPAIDIDDSTSGDLFSLANIRAQADYYAAMVKDFDLKDNPGGQKRFKRAAIALRFMAQFIESHGDQTGVNMVKQWAGVA